MKDEYNKDLDREFAPRKRNPEDLHKVTVVKKESKYNVTTNPDGRIVVDKKEE